MNDACPTAYEHHAVRFTLCGEAQAGLLPRMLQILARRDITPDRVAARRVGDQLHVDLVLRDAAPADSHLVHGNLAQLVGVHSLRREDLVLARVAAPPSLSAHRGMALQQDTAHDMEAAAVAGGA